MGSEPFGRGWIITGGFPCQDISVAGKGAGIEGVRSGLWFEYARLIGEIRPRYAIMENVGALTRRGLDRVLGSLSEIGYDAQWSDIRASDLGAPHRRERIWIVAYPQHAETARQREHSRTRLPFAESIRPGASGEPIPNTGRDTTSRHGRVIGETCQSDWWAVDAGLRRVADELSEGLDGLDEIIISHYHVRYGKKTDTRSAEKLQTVREETLQEAFRGKAGRQVELPKEGVLSSGMHGSVSTWRVTIQSLLETLSEGQLRKLWDKAFSVGSSFGWKQGEQRTRKSGDAMLKVPHNMALAKREIAVDLVLRMRKESGLLGPMFYASDSIEKIWKSLSEAEKTWASVATVLGSWHSEWPGIPRVSHGVKFRVDRLRGLGNAIVPQIAEMIFRGLRACA